MIVVFSLLGILVGTLIGYNFAYKEIMDDIFIVKSKEEDVKVYSKDRVAILKVLKIDKEK